MKHKITVQAGVIDSGFQGEVGIFLHNTSNKFFEINSGDKIAQMIMLQVPMFEVEQSTNWIRLLDMKGGSIAQVFIITMNILKILP